MRTFGMLRVVRMCVIAVAVAVRVVRWLFGLVRWVAVAVTSSAMRSAVGFTVRLAVRVVV